MSTTTTGTSTPSALRAQMLGIAGRGHGPVARPSPASLAPPPWGSKSFNPQPPPSGTTTGVGSGFTPAYPVLTEEIAYQPSPLANSGLSGSRPANLKNASALGPTVTRALQDVLGWKIKPNDAQGFVGALNQAFQLKTVEGSVVSTWKPRAFVVQSDVGGGVAGAQASIYTMATTLLGQILPLIDGLYALDPAADQEYVDALKQLATSQFTNLTNEIGYLGGPRVMRVHQYFQMLLGGTANLNMAGPPSVSLTAPPPTPYVPNTTTLISPPPSAPTPGFPALSTTYYTDPETVLGTLGDLRDLLGLHQTTVHGRYRSYINTIEDEQNVTNFRIAVDYANSLWNGWSNSIQFFVNTTAGTPFLGTQLVIVSRQLGVISETVDEVRFVLDSVFVGPAERQTVLLNFAALPSPPTPNPFTNVPPIYLEDLLVWMQSFVTEEAPGVIQSGGRFGLGEDFCAMIWQLSLHAYGLYLFAYSTTTLAGLNTNRVQASMQKLAAQLYELYTQAYPVGVSYLAPR
jgi:hypothetical protein